MSRNPVRLLILATALALLALPAAASGATRFSYGVAAGDVTSDSAILWTRVNHRARLTLEVSRNRRFRRGVRRFRVRARRSNDYTAQRKVRRLRANRRYYFRFRRGRRRTKRGTFRTAPARRSNRIVEFAWTGDTDFLPARGQRRPFWNSGGVFRQMRRERNHFNVHLGDTIYSDTEVPSQQNRLAPAITVRQKWGKYKLNLRNRHLRGLRQSAGFYSHWDDHEFINDFSPQENVFDNPISQRPDLSINGAVLYRRGVKAFRNYSPVTYSRSNGLYRRVRWGANLELFFLDERSFRSAKADVGTLCNNPQTGDEDLAPTLPQSYRNVYGAVLPSSGLSQPVAQSCLDAINNSNRTFLGRRQMNRFKAAVDRSTARWKIVMNEMPTQQYYALPYDRWEGYEAERQEVLRFLQQRVRNVIFLTTDVHATLVNDARFRTLGPGGPGGPDVSQNSGIFDFTVGSAATANLQLELDQVLGSGGGQLVDNAAFEPQPPAGIGMRCSELNQFSYGQVRVTRNRLTVTSKGTDGNPISGCPPLVLTHR